MTERSRQLQVGILFILSIVVLIMGVLWFKEFRIGGRTYLVNVTFSSTSGLIKGDPVEVQGVTSGKVEAIRYENGRTIVTLRLEDHVVLYPGTEVVLENVGIMGQKLVAVYPGPPGGEPLRRDLVLEGRYQAGIPQLMAGLGGTLETFERFATRMDSLLALFDEAQSGQLKRTLDNTERLTKDLADLMAANRGELEASLRNTNRAMSELNRALEGRGEAVGELLGNAASASARLDSTLITLDRAVARMDRLLARAESPDGTVGKVMGDERLYEDLVATLEEARTLLADIKENPRRYFKVSLF